MDIVIHFHNAKYADFHDDYSNDNGSNNLVHLLFLYQSHIVLFWRKD